MKQLTKLLVAVLCLMLLLGGCAQKPAVQQKDIPLETLIQNIRDAYGEDYIPDSEIPAEFLETTYGLTADLYDEVIAEMALISMFPDAVIVVKAAEGKADDVEAALLTARENAINNTLQYPMNVPKTNATKVVRNGDYIAFLMVGAVGEFEDAQSQESKEFAEAEVQKGVDAFSASFQ